MNTSEDLDYVIIYDENDEPVKRPRNRIYAQIASLQEQQRQPGYKRHEWSPLPPILGESLSETIIRERRGDFD